MSYVGGNNTPITSSDEDDDMDQSNQSVASGNFTESQVDDYQSDQHSQYAASTTTHHPVSEQHFPTDDRLWVDITFDFETKRFEIGRHETLADLRKRVSDEPECEMTQCHFFNLSRDIDDNNYEDAFDEERYNQLVREGRIQLDEGVRASQFHGQQFSIFWKSFELTIVDGMDLELKLRVAQDWTIRRVKEEVDRQHSVRLQSLSHNGIEVTDNYPLSYYGIKERGYRLVSRISITVEDQDCQLSTDLLVCDFWDFEKVLTTYLEVERREFHSSGYLEVQGQRVLEMKVSVYQQQLENSGKITYKVDAYPINIYDSESALTHGSMHGHIGQDLNAVKLMVFDQWTLNDVKKAYSKLTKKPFMEKEKFLSQERELEDDQPLWKLRLRDNEKLIIEREQQEVMVTYICCECGQEVQLRRYDSVQCRQCFHGAVYKQRTARVCQYSCR